jgi:hypothetical protein
LGEEPVSVDGLHTYLRGEKPETSHSTAAWSSHTGKGLLYFVKHSTDDKKHPQGVLNLSEASDLEKAAVHEFSFKINQHKHTFKATSDAERDAWVVAIEKAVTEAKANKDSITNHESYKETLASLAKSHAASTGAGRKSTDANRSRTTSRPRASSSSSSSFEADAAAAKKTKKSRSISRNNMRQTMFGGMMGKKDEKKEKTAENVETPVAAPLEAEAIAARVVDAPVEDAKVVDDKAVEAPANVEEAPVAESGAAAAEEKPLAVKPVEEKKKTEERPKTNKRSSLFGSFLDKVRSPTAEKKESEVAPVVPPKETVVSAEPPVLPKPAQETSNLDPSATAASPALTEAVVEAPKQSESEAAKVTPSATPNMERKASFFDTLVKKARSKSPGPGRSTQAPAVPPKDDEVVAAPVVDAPVAATEAAAADKTTEEPTAPATETKVETPKAVTPKESRRKSYFGGMGPKKEKTDAESPQDDKSLLGKVTGLFRAKSSAAGKKDNVAPTTEPLPTAAAAETTTTTEPVVGEVPAVAETKVDESAAPVAESQPAQNNPTVSAAA